MKRRIEVRIEELQLPAGTRGGSRAADAIHAELARLFSGDARPGPERPHAAVAQAIHDHVAPHVARTLPNLRLR
jgi:hypothetical protein